MDYYLKDKSRLNGQPKRTIAEYVRERERERHSGS